jgi:hypothetical protein
MSRTCEAGFQKRDWKPELIEIGKYDVGRVKTFYDVLQANKIVGRKTIIVAEKK